MKTSHTVFDEQQTLHRLAHYLPAQAPLKDFIHHNTLHSFQHEAFPKAIAAASAQFGYRVSFSLAEYRKLYKQGFIRKEALHRTLIRHKGANQLDNWKQKLIEGVYHKPLPRIGQLRATWKREYRMDMDSQVHPLLFRTLCSYLDQGIAIWNFPVWNMGFLESLREMEQRAWVSFFRHSRARNLLVKERPTLTQLLGVVVGNDSQLYEQYLFDQQFAHQGWSGMVASVEAQPQGLLDTRIISLHDLIYFELLLEIDALDEHEGPGKWLPLQQQLKSKPVGLLDPVTLHELDEVTFLWQEAYEWTYYDEVLNGLQWQHPYAIALSASFQVVLCIDDRACSLRRHLETADPLCETFGTPGFFGVEFFFRPDQGKFLTKLCPAPITPKHLIKEIGIRRKQEKDAHFIRHSHSLFRGWLFAQTLGFWSAFKLLLSVFKPSAGPATSSSFQHMEVNAQLTVECRNPGQCEEGLQVGFTREEMADRVESVLKSMGLVHGFAPLVYVVGHGSSSVNNPHYAAYDCGACSGRAGSVNARVFCHMVNHAGVRALLSERGIALPAHVRFVGGLHDTTRDEIQFYDEGEIPEELQELHHKNKRTFAKALQVNARERARRFESVSFTRSAAEIHEKVKQRSVSLFEPRPELNHATNALCIIGRRLLTRNLFLDRRSFLNSYDYRVDPDGVYLLKIINAAAPVCGGINLEYYFSRVDNQKLGAGTKLPHNVMGLMGVANGIDGDLRPGLPSQMVEVHDPVRLLMVVEHFPEVVLQTIQQVPSTYEWFSNYWIHLVVIHPETKNFYRFFQHQFEDYVPEKRELLPMPTLDHFEQSHNTTMPVYTLQ
jgi:hypothetical protein